MVNNQPMVMMILEIEDLEASLEKWSKLLDSIKKELAKYLEDQRVNFPRFYYVADDDLLEIIGNSKNIDAIQRFFPKMFAGINSIDHKDTKDKLQAIISREGEYVSFEQPVEISKNKYIYLWLEKIETQMKETLASLLAKSIKDYATIEKTMEDQQWSINQEQYFAWALKYPAQITNLSIQIDWSHNVEPSLKK